MFPVGGLSLSLCILRGQSAVGSLDGEFGKLMCHVSIRCSGGRCWILGREQTRTWNRKIKEAINVCELVSVHILSLRFFEVVVDHANVSVNVCVIFILGVFMLMCRHTQVHVVRAHMCLPVFVAFVLRC